MNLWLFNVNLKNTFFLIIFLLHRFKFTVRWPLPTILQYVTSRYYYIIYSRNIFFKTNSYRHSFNFLMMKIPLHKTDTNSRVKRVKWKHLRGSNIRNVNKTNFWTEINGNFSISFSRWQAKLSISSTNRAQIAEFRMQKQLNCSGVDGGALFPRFSWQTSRSGSFSLPIFPTCLRLLCLS